MRLHILLAFPCLLAAALACTKTHERMESSPVGEVVEQLDDRLWIVFQDRRGVHWFGSDGAGIYRVDGTSILRYSTADGLCNDHVRQLLEDESGNIYVNTLGGISRFDGERFTTLIPTEKASASAWTSAPGDLWFVGPQEVNGVYRYDGRSLVHLELPRHERDGEFHAKFPGVNFDPYSVYTIREDSRGSLWFGTSTFGACRFDGTSFTWFSEPELVELSGGPSYGMRGIVEDADGKFWLSNVLHRYDAYPTGSETTGPAFRREPALLDATSRDDPAEWHFMSGLRDERGVLWLAMYGGNVWRWDGRERKTYPVVDGGRPVPLFSIYEDRKGTIWLGTPEFGAYRFDGTAFAPFRP